MDEPKKGLNSIDNLAKDRMGIAYNIHQQLMAICEKEDFPEGTAALVLTLFKRCHSKICRERIPISIQKCLHEDTANLIKKQYLDFVETIEEG